MSWSKKLETEGKLVIDPVLRTEPGSGVMTLDICLVDGDAEYQSVSKELYGDDFEKIILRGSLKSLEVLRGCKNITNLHVLAKASFLGIESLENIRKLTLETVSQRPHPNFGLMGSLEECNILWDKSYNPKNEANDLFKSNKIKYITILKWNKKDCLDFSTLKNLQRIDLRQGTLESMSGIEECALVNDISLSYLPRLVDISALGQLYQLKNLNIKSCPDLNDVSSVLKLKDIRSIHIEDVGFSLEDISWLSEMKTIRKICLSTEIRKIDWAVIFNHPSIVDVAIRTHDGYDVADQEILRIAELSGRKINNFKRVGTKKRPAFVFDII